MGKKKAPAKPPAIEPATAKDENLVAVPFALLMAINRVAHNNQLRQILRRHQEKKRAAGK